VDCEAFLNRLGTNSPISRLVVCSKRCEIRGTLGEAEKLCGAGIGSTGLIPNVSSPLLWLSGAIPPALLRSPHTVGASLSALSLDHVTVVLHIHYGHVQSHTTICSEDQCSSRETFQ